MRRITTAALGVLAASGIAIIGPATNANAAVGEWGVFSAPNNPVASDICGANKVKSAEIEWSWSNAETANGTYNDTYINGFVSAASRLITAGCSVVISPGLQHAPSWAKALGQDFTDENGNHPNTATDIPNFITNQSTATGSLRDAAQLYLAHVKSKFGTTALTAIRVGAGYLGELDYPPCNSGTTNCWWGYDSTAQALLPSSVKGWKPGTGTTSQAQTFQDTYFGWLVNEQNWLITATRNAGWTTTDIQVLYPGFGCRAADKTAEVTALLVNSKSDCYRAMDHPQDVNGLPSTDTHVQVYSTWGDNTATSNPASELSGLAVANGRPYSAENAGPGSTTKAANLVSNCKLYNAKWCGYIRYTDPGWSDFKLDI